jgi:hypothetical protein
VHYLLILLLMQPQVELKDKLYGRFSPTTDVTADRVSYATEYGMRVPAIVYHRAGATINLHPGLIIIGKDKSYSYAAGIVYARAGAVVLTFDPVGEFERDWQKRSGVALPDDGLAQRRAELMQMDIAQGTRYLASRKDVDPKHIAVIDFPSLLTRPVALQLYEKLKFSNWTKKQILAMPEQLGTDIPKVAREDLKAIPDIVWDADQDAFVYEAWRKKVTSGQGQP